MKGSSSSAPKRSNAEFTGTGDLQQHDAASFSSKALTYPPQSAFKI